MQILQKLNIVVDDLKNTWAIKVNVVRSREMYPKIHVTQEKDRKKYLELTNRLYLLAKER